MILRAPVRGAKQDGCVEQSSWVDYTINLPKTMNDWEHEFQTDEKWVGDENREA